MAYDPQKTRNRPAPAADRPAPVDAFLDAMSEVAEEIFIDTAPRAPSDLADRTKTPVVQSREADRSKLVIGIVAAVVALVAVLVVTRKRR